MLQVSGFRPNETISTTHIILICVSSGIFVLAILIVLYRCWKHPKATASLSKQDAYTTSVELNTMTAFPPIDIGLLEFKIEFTRLQYTRKLATGAFGEVWLGQLDGSYVAIKQILPEKRQEHNEIKGFLAEITLVAKLQHQNILKFIGFSWSPKEYNLCFCTEYLKHGDLFTNLQASKPWSWQKEKIQIALDVARGLVYLHSFTPKIIHRDLKSRNILLDDAFEAKITDFGIFENTKFDAMVVLKLVTMEHALPNFTADCPDTILDLARRCLSFDPVNRPTAVELVEFLESVVIPELVAQTQLFAF
ncbi:kinase [Thraustotheca clavata]|uniref:Kinase n=1 Tax=Thraustotheca clavata TaxID=74557 RepID=A0A1W0A3D4_9STRA|nr:kinase [Thraustotheca clavata]